MSNNYFKIIKILNRLIIIRYALNILPFTMKYLTPASIIPLFIL